MEISFELNLRAKEKIYTCIIVSSTKVQVGPNVLALGLV
jgi:hypothetical protein